MKLLCTIINVLALLAVLVLGAGSAHAESVAHSHVHVAATFEVPATPDGVDPHSESPSPSDPAMHCGAAILGLEAVAVNYAFGVTEVDFYPEISLVLSDVTSDDLRPPRA